MPNTLHQNNNFPGGMMFGQKFTTGGHPGISAVSQKTQQMGAGETFTVTCFTCGMPSSKEWAQRVSSRPRSPGKAFFPFLHNYHYQNKSNVPVGAQLLNEDGSTFLCAFCHASLEAQWSSFEKANTQMRERHYNLNNFICAVCSVETYRKRVRALPFQEFPFLAKERPAGSLTLGNNPLAVVCLDCSETLWAQSAEYDRWGLPIQKRHFNWMSRPPPPENSVEATVARLPSGETQLPRCPPTEPLVIPRRKEGVPIIPKPITEFSHHLYPSSQSQSKPPNQQALAHRPVRTSLSSERRSPGSEPSCLVNGKSPASRKTSGNLSEHSSLIPQQVPVVTVAPMTSHSITTTTTSFRKEQLQPNLISMGGHSKSESQRGSQQKIERSSNASNQCPPAVFIPTPSSYGNLALWSGTGNLMEHYQQSQVHPPPPLDSIGPSSQIPQSQWSWIPPPPITNPDFMRYQAYLASLANTNYANAIETYFSQPHPHPLLQTSDGISSSVFELPEPRIRTLSASRSPNNTTNSKTSVSHYPSPMSHSQNQPQQTLVEGLGSKYTAISALLTNHPTADVLGSRKLSSGSISPPSMSKLITIGNSGNNSNMTMSKPPELTPRLTRHLNPTKGVTKNKDYIVSVSAIISESEASRPRSMIHQDPFQIKRKQGMHERGQGMDMSLISAHSSPIQNIPPFPTVNNNWSGSKSMLLSRPGALPTNHPSYPSGQDPNQVKPPNSNFMIANLCSENMSPPQGSKAPGNTDSDNPNRNSVIVNLRSPTRDESLPMQLQSSLPQITSSEELCCIVRVEKETRAPSSIVIEVEDSEESESSCILAALLSPNCATSRTKVTTAKVEPEIEATAKKRRKATVSVSSECQSETLSVLDGDGEHKNENDATEVVHEPKEAEEVDVDMTEVETQKEPELVDMEKIYVKKDKIIDEEEERSIFDNSVMEFKRQEADRLAIADKEKAEKAGFLRLFQLIPPSEKADIDLRMLESRFDKRTLPPMKFRAAEPVSDDEVVSEAVEKNLLLTAFEDPSLKKSMNNPRLLKFMNKLEMKPASKVEKYRREENWRLVLAERVLRQRRGQKFDLSKRPWDKVSNITKDLLLMRKNGRMRRRHSIPPTTDPKTSRTMRSLSVTLPREILGSSGIGSSDLLTTVSECKSSNSTTAHIEKEVQVKEITERSQPSNRMGMNSQNLEKMLTLTHRSRQPVISYPRYIPSYATTATVQRQSPTAAVSPFQNAETTVQSTQQSIKEYGNINVLNVPIIPRIVSLSTSNHIESNFFPLTSTLSSTDSLLQKLSTCWKETKDEAERLVKVRNELKTDDDNSRRRLISSDLKRLRKTISAQQSDMKLLVKWLKQLSD